MKIINLLLILSIPLLILTSIIRIYTIESWYNDCMLEYDKIQWYIYKIDDYKYHIDNKKLNHLELIWYSKWCFLYWNNKYALMFLSNSIYCSVTRFL